MQQVFNYFPFFVKQLNFPELLQVRPACQKWTYRNYWSRTLTGRIVLLSPNHV